MTTHYVSSIWADERNVLGVISCVSASGVNLMRAATDGGVPATDGEVIALRTAAHDLSGGQTLASLADGLEHRYDVHAQSSGESWQVIVNGLAVGTWWVIVGWYETLPERLRNVGQGNVFHAVLVGPRDNGYYIVDALQRTTIMARAIGISEIRTFAASGSFGGLGLREFSHCDTVTVRPLERLYTVYPDHHYYQSLTPVTGAFRNRAGPVGTYERKHRNPRRLAQILAGPHKGRWTNVNSSNVIYTRKTA